MSFDYKRRVATQIADHPIGKLLDSLRMESAFYTSSTLMRPWGMVMPPMSNCMMYHIVLEGAAEFRIADSVFPLEEGGFVLFPKGEGHVVSDGQCKTIVPLAELPIESVTERYETLTFGGSGEVTRMVCGAMLFQHPLAIKLLGILPPYIRIHPDSKDSVNVVTNVARLLKSESETISVGAEAVISRLADVLVVAAMRQYLSELDESKTGWLTALQDDRIGKSLKLIHDQPSKHWSLEELAIAVGMSRTSFATQFKKLVGNSPMEYLTEWRMSLAYSRLQLTGDTVLSIALDIGYQSESAFSRAFKKSIGKSPVEVRKDYEASVETT
ncbi:AraC family transcriptional regulator [Thiosocius teredinicola]|uniref:AraC family transcriptional regulator n=1 Tax=Thiosocius teredinicola TaxID=1973002 RepID=UPI000990B284